MHFQTVALIGKYQDASLIDPLRELAQALQGAGCRVLVESDTAHNTGLHEYAVATDAEIAAQADLAVVMGGDGTMLSAARRLAQACVPLIGINLGRLGFITDIALPDARDALMRVIRGEYTAEERVLLEGRVVRGSETMYSGVALNDVVINRAGRGGMIELRVAYDDVFMYSQRADGLIIAAPTGSTAYALSAHGPILHPGLNAILLVPVAPQTLSNRPIVLPDSGTLSITLTMMGRVESGASVHFDMQTWSDCQPGDRIDVRRSQHAIRFVHPTGYSFFSTLRHKLHWNRMPHPGDAAE